MDAQLQTPKKHKWLFWLILGAFSTFFAEVFAGSDMFPFFHLFGVLVVWPLYGLHIIILATIIFRCGRPRLSTLVFAGMLFGLYEAYLTKVLWNPDWGAIIKFGDVAVVEVVVLVFWWHAWLSFIVPLVVGETLLTNSRETAAGLPEKLRRFFTSWEGRLAVVIFGGVFQSVNSPSPLQSLLSGLSTTGFLIALTLLWRRVTRRQTYVIQDLLPNKREFHFLLAWLLLIYLVEGLYIRPEALPGFVGQALIWLLYALIFALLHRSLKKSRQLAPAQTETLPPHPGGKTWLLLALAFTATAAAAKALLAPWAGPVIAAAWFGGGIFGLVVFFGATKDALRQKNAPVRAR